MSDRFIVSGYKFMQHKNISGALSERDRLRAEHPGKQFHVYRIKDRLNPSNAGEKIERMREMLTRLRILIDGFPPSEPRDFVLADIDRSLKDVGPSVREIGTEAVEKEVV
jgi:hypothetical protein